MSNFFTKATSSQTTPRAPMRVIQSAAPPASDAVTEATYKYFPLNVAMTQDIASAKTSTWTGGAVQYLLWCNRWNNGHNKKPNRTNPVVTTGGTETWLDYSSIAKANAATLARASYASGYAATDGGDGWQEICDAAGLVCVTWATFNADPSAYGLTTRTVNGVTYQVVTDVCVLPADRLCDCLIPDKELCFDYEPQDGRSTSETLDVCTQVIGLAHAQGIEVSLYTNPWDGNQAIYNGFVDDGGNWIAADLLDLFDYVSLPIWLDNETGTMLESLHAQIDKFGEPDYPKFFILYFLKGNTAYPTVAQAQTIRDELEQHRYAGIHFFPNGATMGAMCDTNSAVINQIAVLTGLSGC